MQDRNILRVHYIKLLRRVVAWAGVGSIAASTLVASTAMAAPQLTQRTALLGNSKAGATTTYDFSFRPATTATIKSIKFQVCTSPLETTSCSASNSSSLSGGSFVAGSSTAPFTSNWAAGSGGLAATATAFYVKYTTGDSLANTTTYTVRLSGVVNPNVANTQFYTRVTTYTDDTATTEQDFGAMAVSTGTEIDVNANVQESLQFNVGSSGTCGSITGSSVNIGNNPGTDNVLQIGTATAGTSVMCVNTNASGGYVISYASNSTHNNAFTNGTYDIADSSGGSTFASAVSGGTDLFGLNVRSNNGGSSGPTAGADPSGGVAPTSYGAAYGTANTYGFVHGTQTTLVSETTGPTSNTLYTVT
jgi:hypothetical protein